MTSNNRVTTQEFYEALLDLKDEQSRLEHRITAKIDKLIDEGTPGTREARALAKENSLKIHDLEQRSNRWSGFNTALTIIGSTLGVIFGQDI